jgi:hypothetical protein
MSMKAILAQRFAPLNFSVVPGFPNPAPSFSEWAYFLPIFSEKDEDNLAHHVIKFHQYMDQLNIHHEDVVDENVYVFIGSKFMPYNMVIKNHIVSFQDLCHFKIFESPIYGDFKTLKWI